MKRWTILAGLALALSAPAAADEPLGHLYWRPAAQDTAPRPWAVLLTGGGGLDIFGDRGAYYFSYADMLNRRGFDVLLVDYLAVLEPVAEVGMANYGGEIARIAEEGVAHERAQGRMDARCDGLVVSWSMGGEGLLDIVGREPGALAGLASAIAYYPSVQGRPEGFAPGVPLTIFQGEADQLTPLAALRKFLGTAQPGAPIDLHTFPGAGHGFDIDTLAQPVLEGRFAHDESADVAADAMLDAWMASRDFGCALD